MLRLNTVAASAIALLSLGFLTTAACSVVVGSDADLGGSPSTGGAGTGGKKGSGGSGTGGKASGGGAGEAGIGGASASGGMGGGAAKLDCQDDGTADGTYAPPSSSGACAECLQSNCEPLFKTCYSVTPDSACLYGSTSFMVGGSTVEGEFDCMLACFNERSDSSDFLADEDDLDECQARCGSAECDADAAGPVTTNLAECLLGLSTDDDPDGCLSECGLEL